MYFSKISSVPVEHEEHCRILIMYLSLPLARCPGLLTWPHSVSAVLKIVLYCSVLSVYTLTNCDSNGFLIEIANKIRTLESAFNRWLTNIGMDMNSTGHFFGEDWIHVHSH